MIGPSHQLTEPFGFGNGDSIALTLVRPDRLDESSLRFVLQSYSCYPPAIDKIVACMRASGRYDCTLQTAWFRKQHANVRADLALVGIDMRITNIADGPTRWVPPLHQKSRAVNPL